MSADDTGTGAAPQPSAYQGWACHQGVRIIEGHHIRDLRSVVLDDWDRIGGRGALIHHDATDAANDCQLCEIPSGGSLAPERHLYEEMIYVLKGHGATTVWRDGEAKQTFEWQAGSLFAVPLNTWHQHFNAHGERPARFLAVTNAPTVMNLFDDESFVFDTAHRFADRFDGESDAFDGTGILEGWLWSTNFVPDTGSIELQPYPLRGRGARKLELDLAGNTMGAHISAFPVGTYKMAHRHGPGAHVIVLDGEGYTLMWQEGSRPERYDWSDGAMVVPPDGWFHQHFNTGARPARYLALRYKAVREKHASGEPMSRVSTRDGGWQIEYQDEDPLVREMYATELAERGIELGMEAVSP